MSVWTHDRGYDRRYTAGVADRTVYRNVNGDYVAHVDGSATRFGIYRWRWLAKLAADWWL